METVGRVSARAAAMGGWHIAPRRQFGPQSKTMAANGGSRDYLIEISRSVSRDLNRCPAWASINLF